MKCRCFDMCDCKYELKNLETIKEIINNSISSNSNITESLDVLSTKYENTFEVSNLENLKTESKKLNNGTKEILKSMKVKCENAIVKLNTEYEELKKEDNEYHTTFKITRALPIK